MSNWYECHRTCGECRRICTKCNQTCEEYQNEQRMKFYNQYMQEHAALTQWILRNHRNPSSSNPPHVSQHTYDPQPCQHAEPLNVIPHQRHIVTREQKKSSTNRRPSPDSNKAARYSSSHDESSSSEESCSDSSSSYSESSSDEMEDIKEDDDELLKPMAQEIEYLPFDRFGEIPTHGRRMTLYNRAEEEDREEWLTMLYGDDKNTIKAIETAIDLDFCRTSDLLQPFIWPILPIHKK